MKKTPQKESIFDGASETYQDLSYQLLDIFSRWSVPQKMLVQLTDATNFTIKANFVGDKELKNKIQISREREHAQIKINVNNLL